MGVTEAYVGPVKDEPELQVADQDFFVHAATVADGVAVEKDVVRNRPPLEAGKQVPVEIGLRCEVRRARQGAAMLRRQFLHGDGSLFDQVLDDPTLATVLDAHGKPNRERLYPPQDTLRLFIGQVLSADRACQDVVGRCLSERLAHGQPASALNSIPAPTAMRVAVCHSPCRRRWAA